ncbi:hypersensitive response-inducing protein [Byssothecium circinans]|uniref:Hypersensitive response-inducing protein n=1 Tax=Byssothecium circinans TaxID=147558 RepID=A0A6A5UDT0_9PLEO|nr:hypersensitive response-inducing protein [Byssothecium circinans]
MQFLAAASLLAATASAAVIRQSAVYQVTDFKAACVPHSVMCNYSFDVVQTGTGETTPIKCSASTNSNGNLPEITDGTCENSSRTFTVTETNDGSLVLAVTRPVTPNTNLNGQHIIRPEEVVREQTGASIQERYIGPTEFGLTPF